MNKKDNEAVKAYSNELENLTYRFIQNWDITFEELVGCIDMHKGWIQWQHYSQIEEKKREGDGGGI